MVDQSDPSARHVSSVAQEPALTLAMFLSDHGLAIQRVAYSIVGDHHAAEDITADTLVTAWLRISTLRDPARVRPWLLAIAARHALQHLRRSSRQDRFVGVLPQNARKLDTDIAVRLTLRSAIDALPPRMRTVITLRYVADLSLDEIASAIGRSRNTVKTELRLGLHRLREHLADTDLGVSK